MPAAFAAATSCSLSPIIAASSGRGAERRDRAEQVAWVGFAAPAATSPPTTAAKKPSRPRPRSTASVARCGLLVQIARRRPLGDERAPASRGRRDRGACAPPAPPRRARGSAAGDRRAGARRRAAARRGPAADQHRRAVADHAAYRRARQRPAADLAQCLVERRCEIGRLSTSVPSRSKMSAFRFIFLNNL